MTTDETPEAILKEEDDPKDLAAGAADEIRDAAARKAGELKDAAAEKGAQLKEAAFEQLGSSREKFEELRLEGERYVRDNPGKSVLIALGLGFIIGRIIK